MWTNQGQDTALTHTPCHFRKRFETSSNRIPSLSHLFRLFILQKCTLSADKEPRLQMPQLPVTPPCQQGSSVCYKTHSGPSFFEQLRSCLHTQSTQTGLCWSLKATWSHNKSCSSVVCHFFFFILIIKKINNSQIQKKVFMCRSLRSQKELNVHKPTNQKHALARYGHGGEVLLNTMFCGGSRSLQSRGQINIDWLTLVGVNQPWPILNSLLP